MKAIDRFTKEELLAAAGAAEVYPSGHGPDWGVTAMGMKAKWPRALRVKYP